MLFSPCLVSVWLGEPAVTLLCQERHLEEEPTTHRTEHDRESAGDGAGEDHA